MLLTAAAEWKPTPQCTWCQSRFVRRAVGGLDAFVCPTPACYERCEVWATFVDARCLFFPLPKQAELFEIVESHVYRQILWGGPLGAAKSFGLRHLAYHYCRRFENFHALLLRRTYPELEGSHIIDTVHEIDALNSCFDPKKPVAKYATRRIDFYETDAILKYGHCQNPSDYKAYLSAAFDLIIFDQLETFEDVQHQEISARTGRIRRDGWRGTVLSGENPGGPGSAFVDELFVSKTRDPKKYPKYRPEDYFYMPASMNDNPYLDDGYEDFIGDLGKEKRAMYRHGDRSVFPGQFFPSFDKTIHVRSVA